MSKNSTSPVKLEKKASVKSGGSAKKKKKVSPKKKEQQIKDVAFDTERDEESNQVFLPVLKISNDDLVVDSSLIDKEQE